MPRATRPPPRPPRRRRPQRRNARAHVTRATRLDGKENGMTKLNLKIEHQVPGRVRMKIPAGKGNPELLKQVSEAFGVIPGIEEVTVNPTTGSVVLYYDTERHDDVHGHLSNH